MALTKAEMAEALFNQLGLNKREARELVDLFFEEVRGALSSGEQVKLSGEDGSVFAGTTAILPTDHDGLWLKAPQGIVQIPHDELAAFVHDHTHAVRYRTFDIASDFAAPLARSNYATTKLTQPLPVFLN